MNTPNLTKLLTRLKELEGKRGSPGKWAVRGDPRLMCKVVGDSHEVIDWDGNLDGADAAFIAETANALQTLIKVIEVQAGALDILTREFHGTLKTHEWAIRNDSGNSNFNCMEIAVEKARQAQSQVEEIVGGGGEMKCTKEFKMGDHCVCAFCVQGIG